MASFLHSGDLGDIVYALPIIKMLGGGKLYLTSGYGAREAMTPARIEFIRPLLRAQDYIESVEPHKGQAIKHDFTGFREGYVTDVPVGVIQQRHVSPFQRVDYTKSWLTVPVEKDTRPVFARSPRYHNPEGDKMWPKIIARHPNAKFVGTREEFEAFDQEFGGAVEYAPVSDSIHMARIIAAAPIFCGNQSFPLSIAEGLKMPVIVEHCVKQPDAFWVRHNATRLYKAKDWPWGSIDTKFMLALQTYPGDYNMAVESAKFITEIEPVFRHDVEFAVCVRDDLHQDQAETLVNILRSRFKTHLVRSKRSGRGWPEGCNDLWQSSMQQLGRMRRDGKTNCEAVLTFEPDCIPLRRDWIAVLIQEWIRVRDLGKMAFGTVHDAGGPAGLHLNGNMVLSIDAMKRFPALQSSGGSWDCCHAGIFLNNGLDSPTIIQRYAERRTLTVEDFAAIQKGGTTPAFIHGIKAVDAFDVARQLLKV